MEPTLLQETRTNRDLFARVLVSEVETLADSLRHLDERSRASIIVLVGAAQLITAYERSLNSPSDSIGEDFDAILEMIHPDGARMLSGLRTAGLAESIVYAWTLARCRVAPDEQSEEKAARAATAEVASAMAHVDALMDLLRHLGLPARITAQGGRGIVRSLRGRP